MHNMHSTHYETDYDFSLEEEKFDLAIEDYFKYQQLQKKIDKIGCITREDLVPFEKYLPANTSLESFNELPSKENVNLIVSMEASEGVIAAIITAIIAAIVGMIAMFSGGGTGKSAGSIVLLHSKRHDAIKNLPAPSLYKESPKVDQDFKEAVYEPFTKLDYVCSVGYTALIPLFTFYPKIVESIKAIETNFVPKLKGEVNKDDPENRINYDVFKGLLIVLDGLLESEDLPVDKSHVNELEKEFINKGVVWNHYEVEDHNKKFNEIAKYFETGIHSWYNKIWDKNNKIDSSKFPGTKDYMNKFRNRTDSLNTYLSDHYSNFVGYESFIKDRMGSIEVEIDRTKDAINRTDFKSKLLIIKLNDLSKLLKVYGTYFKVTTQLTAKSYSILTKVDNFGKIYLGYLWHR